MERFIRGWRRTLIGLLPLMLVLVACSGATDESNRTGETAEPLAGSTTAEPAAVANLNKFRAVSSDEPIKFLTVNVRLTDEGYEPSSVSIPVGQRVKLVVRNHGKTEHHYKVSGLVPGDLLWRRPTMVTDDDDEHLAHHPRASYVAVRSASKAGIKPTGDEVHAYAERGALDVLFFTATNTGTFVVQDPLHPEIVGEVTVTAPATVQELKTEKALLRTQELLRTTSLSKFNDIHDIKFEVLYAPPAYFAMAVDEEGVDRYNPEEFYVFLISETIHEGESLPETPPPATLRVDGQETALFDTETLIGSSHHRMSVARFAHPVDQTGVGGSGVGEKARGIELLIADASPLSWELSDAQGSTTAESANRSSVFGLSWALLLPGLAGMLAALGPCLTQLVVYYVATLTGVGMEVLEDPATRSAQRRRVLRTAIYFSLGFTVVYTAGGALAGMIGQRLQSLGLLQTLNWPLSIAAGVVMLWLGWRVMVNARAPLVCKLPLASKIKSENGTGFWGSMMTGIAFAFGCLSCFGATVLTVLLLYIGAEGSIMQGTFIMFVFSLGLTVPFLLAAMAMGRILPLLNKFERVAPWMGLAGGAVMIGFGLLMISYRFHIVSSLVYRWLFV